MESENYDNYLDVDTDTLVSVTDQETQKLVTSIITDDGTILSTALKTYKVIKEQRRNDKIVADALAAVKLFYENIINDNNTVTCLASDGKLVYEGKGKKNDPKYNTCKAVWESLQNEKVCQCAIDICKQEGVILELDYGENWSWKMTCIL